MQKNYYDILGVSKKASQDEIKTAYRKQAFKHHPVRNSEKEYSDGKMKELNFIYSILSNPQQKRTYDDSIAFNADFEYKQERDDYRSHVNIFCNEIMISDSHGITSTIKVGQNIFYLVEIDKSIITWKYKTKEYFNLTIKKIFDPNQKENFSKVTKYDLTKNPLFLVHIREKDMIIYKEDFENHWLSEKTYKASDCSVIQSKEENNISTLFLAEVLKTKQKEIYNLQQGAGQPHVYSSDLVKLNIPVPPKLKQKEIAEHISKIRAKAKQLESYITEIRN